MVTILNSQHMSPAEIEQGNGLLPCLSSHTMNKCPTWSLSSATFFTLWVFAVAIVVCFQQGLHVA
jgi:hypothetical protein